MKANWKEGSWTAEPGAERTARITIAADWMPLRAYESVIASSPLAVYGDLLPIFRDSDFNVVNVESTLGTCGAPHSLFGRNPQNAPPFRAAESTVRSLSEAPFHAACLANNHIMDFGAEGLERTLQVLRGAGLSTVGAGMTGEEASRPLFAYAAGARLAILNCAEGEWSCSVDNGPGAYGFEVADITRKVQALRQEADLVLVIYHGGREYVPAPPVYIVKRLRAIAEAGASAVVAHHPHVPQGIEIYGGVPIVYSQGNFVFWQENDLYYRHVGYLVHLDIGRERIAGMQITPYLIERTGLSAMRGEEKSSFLNTLHAVSGLLAQPDDIRSVWNAFADQVGLPGMIQMLKSGMNAIEADERKGAGQLLNAFFTPAHSEFYIDGFRRAAGGQLGDSPEWAKAWVHHWHHYSLAEAKQQTPDRVISFAASIEQMRRNESGN